MFDYKLLEALVMVASEQGFEKAAERLFISQSAVSQRIKSLEDQVGSILITRTNPPLPTEMGKRLIKHCHQVMRLEEEIPELMETDESSVFSTVPVGINNDSLELWFLDAVKDLLCEEHILLDVRVHDQDMTRVLLQDGTVSGVISSSNRKLQGCSITPIGSMAYLPVCTPEFARTWFPEGFSKASVIQAPAVIFNRVDTLLDQLFEKVLGISSIDYPSHFVPSTHQFLTMIEHGLAYGMTPLMQCEDLLKNRRLVSLIEKPLAVNLYWHCWNIASESLAAISDAVILGSREYLR